MESELVKESVVRGHHIYKEVWSPVVGELLPVLRESNNVHDRRAVTVFKDGNIVGHVTRELSRIFWSISTMRLLSRVDGMITIVTRDLEITYPVRLWIL